MWKQRARRAPDRREGAVLEAVRALLEASRRSSGAVLAALADHLCRCDAAVDDVLVFVPEGDELVCALARGARVEHYDSARIPRESEPRWRNRPLVPAHRAVLALPMLDAEELRALVYCGSAADSLTDEAALAQTIACAASPYVLALEREAARADATYDGLTGLLTPRAFRAHLREEIARSAYAGSRILSLWFIDTDHFKAVNDAFGHGAGDTVLQRIAGLLRAHLVDEIDVAGRNGGDEFCALLRGAQKTLAIERAQALCEAVRRTDFGIGRPITASIGVASFPHDARDANALLEAADAAMYHSKRSGRDRVAYAIDGTEFLVFRRTTGE